MKTNTITAVPKLRFPEFRSNESWKSTTLENVAELNPSNPGLPNKFIYIDLESVQDSMLLNRKETSTANAPSRAQRLLEYEDVLFQTVRPYQKNNFFFLLKDDHNYVASTGYAQLRAFESASYLNQYIYNERFVSRVLEHCAGSNYPAISSKNLAKISVEIPSLPEQQKIANCLSSLDDSIDAETQQLESLKTHKAGLLQQLFPAEGEMIPKRRFAEFEGDGDWEEVKLVDVAETSIGLVTTMTTSYVEKGIPLIRNSDIKPNAIRMTKLINLSKEFADKYENKRLLKNDIVTVHTGDIGVSALVEQDLEGSLGFATLNTRVTSSSVSPEFVCWFFNSPEYKRFALSMATGDGRNNFNLRDFNKTILFIPDILEQQKIVDCLSSLDNLIQAKDEKIKMLKEHKQGLMQQLFPVMDGE
ncbi:restriction endonuclease subunit S [uncultured Psychrobacter sp.]|uniref:restriction endonuclease subunit S n=1 Tax=uncultured Psychrobacter sp. TaxID=259303 RepID=UPI003459F0FB